MRTLHVIMDRLTKGSTLFLIAICAALLSEGFALQCEVCFAIDTNTCTGHYKTCKPNENRCMVTLTETSVINGERTTRSAELEKSCASDFNCTHPATLNAKQFKVRVTRTCCDRDFCNNGTIEWKRPEPKPENGVTCDYCFSKDPKTCDVKTPINCTGDETYCVHYLAHRNGGSSISVAGCASESMQKSGGRAAFRGSSIIVQNAGTSWRQETYVLLWLAVILCQSLH